MEIRPIAYIENDFREKFGVPRQSGLAEGVLSRIVFLPEYRRPEAFRGLEAYTRIWLIWEFSEGTGEKADWSPTVRPPKLGGNTRVGVFASRSPNRPNPLGLSAVRLEEILWDDPEGPVLTVSGADLMNGTPIYDIKPYLPYADAFPDARGSFGQERKDRCLTVRFLPGTEEQIPAEKQAALREILSLDPRPGYQDDPERVYGLAFGAQNVRFRADGEILTVLSVETGGNA